MSDTPETDANTEYDAQDGSPFAPCRQWVHANFARKLERERDEARRELQAERDLPTNLLDVNAICLQRDEARRDRDVYKAEMWKARNCVQTLAGATRHLLADFRGFKYAAKEIHDFGKSHSNYSIERVKRTLEQVRLILDSSVKEHK